MFNKRRIHTVTACKGWGNAQIGIDDAPDIDAYNDVGEFIGSKAHFALRPFAGAARFRFVYKHNAGHYSFSGEYHTTNPKLRLCAKGCENILGIGKKTKQFSIWFKRI